MAAAEHHPDCDGWMNRHLCTIVQTSREGRGMWSAQCDRCGWTGRSFGPDGISGAATDPPAYLRALRTLVLDLTCRELTPEANNHSSPAEPCDGRCLNS